MKNLLLTMVSIILIGFTVNAQGKKKATDKQPVVPDVIQASFKTQYPDVAEVRWNKMHSGNYQSVFTNASGREQTTEFNAAGEIVRTKIAFSSEGVDEHLMAAIHEKYADATVTALTKYELAGVPAYYKVKIQTANQSQKDILMSEEGAITE
ncbi:MAG: PepSY-like domain-containing protein [Ferruginibacter sp.]|nr:PepSY-like domain-containing protein [Ferruginibacter sp.]